MGVRTTSIADGIPFDPSDPSTYPSEFGQSFFWDQVAQTWKISDQIGYHRQVAVPDSFTTTLNSTNNLTATQNAALILSGTATGYSVVMPNATQLLQGQKYEIYNTSNQVVLIKDNSGTTIVTLGQNSTAYGYLQSNGSAAGVWIWFQILNSSIASGIISYTLTSSTPFTTASTTDVVITGFSLTPQAGTYGVWYNSESFQTTTPRFHYWSLFLAGSKITDSERTQDTAHSNQNMVDTTMTIVSFNGSQTCDVRVRTENGSLTINARSLLLIRLGT
jgi:hypothetical protein